MVRSGRRARTIPVRRVRRVAAERPTQPTRTKRSITDGWSSDAGTSSRPVSSPKDAKREAANKSALARAPLGGLASATTDLAKEPAAASTARGVNRSIVRTTGSVIVQ